MLGGELKPTMDEIFQQPSKRASPTRVRGKASLPRRAIDATIEKRSHLRIFRTPRPT
jgi:hypothetical protein